MEVGVNESQCDPGFCDPARPEDADFVVFYQYYLSGFARVRPARARSASATE